LTVTRNYFAGLSSLHSHTLDLSCSAGTFMWDNDEGRCRENNEGWRN